MKVQKILSQHRRDFQAIYECEHCGQTSKGGGY
jgi:ribosomal protein L37AE/L43A